MKKVIKTGSFFIVFLSALRSFGWGWQHATITEAAIHVLPQADRDVVGMETNALIHHYCEFPDINWPCYGEWGNGDGNPLSVWLPDVRREWDVSFYCCYDPVLTLNGVKPPSGYQRGYAHRYPDSLEAVPLYFHKAVDALQKGRRIDAIRFAGVMLHYIEDTGALPQIQPIHRTLNAMRYFDGIGVNSYTPQMLGKTLDEVDQSLRQRLTELVETTESCVSPILAGTGWSTRAVAEQCKRELMPIKIVETVQTFVTNNPTEFKVIACNCANACVRLSADTLHTLFILAQQTEQEPVTNALGINLVFNSSFEEDDGDQIPDGWFVKRGDRSIRDGCTEWYRKGTHFDHSMVKTGVRSVLLLWAPKTGLTWCQTWRRALSVKKGERYESSAWAYAKNAAGHFRIELETADANYCVRTIVQNENTPLKNERWVRLKVSLDIPEKVCWLRLALYSDAQTGAVWFDDVSITKER